MTNTDTADIESSVQQIAALARAGSELVRITVNNDDAAQSRPLHRRAARRQGLEHAHHRRLPLQRPPAPRKYPDCAEALAKYRINPGNCSIGRKDDDNFRTMVEVAVKHQKPVRIGVNWGSLDQALLTKMMDENSKPRRSPSRPRRHDGSHGRLRASTTPPPPSATASAATRSSSPPRSPAFATSSTSTPSSPAAATTPCTSASPKPAWA